MDNEPARDVRTAAGRRRDVRLTPERQARILTWLPVPTRAWEPVLGECDYLDISDNESQNSRLRISLVQALQVPEHTVDQTQLSAQVLGRKVSNTRRNRRPGVDPVASKTSKRCAADLSGKPPRQVKG